MENNEIKKVVMGATTTIIVVGAIILEDIKHGCFIPRELTLIEPMKDKCILVVFFM